LRGGTLLQFRIRKIHVQCRCRFAADGGLGDFARRCNLAAFLKCAGFGVFTHVEMHPKIGDQVRADRVQALAEQYQTGRYAPSASATSRGMVSQLLTSGLQ